MARYSSMPWLAVFWASALAEAKASTAALHIKRVRRGLRGVGVMVTSVVGGCIGQEQAGEAGRRHPVRKR